MIIIKQQRKLLLFAIMFSLLSGLKLFAQTEFDGIMMNKKQWCNGVSYMHSQWTNYWEGTFKRNNQNIGTISTQSVMFMSNYGIKENLNVLVSAPYVFTNASAGTLHGLKGFQDASVYIKWRPVTIKQGSSKFSLFAVGGLSTPLQNYNVELLPLSIGLGSTNVTGRLIADYQKGILFATASASYTRRSNVSLDRTSYYTTELHNSNKVKMPNMSMYGLMVGIRKKYLILQAELNNTTTLGGFDIRKNDMPFVSNTMNSTAVGVHAKYTLPFYKHIELTGNASRVISGRNVGQATALGAGVYYLFSFHHKTSSR